MSPPVAAITVTDIGLNRSIVKALLRQLYADREPSPDSQYSQFVEELAAVGVTGIKKLQTLLIGGRDSASQSEAANPPVDEDDNPTVFTDVGFARESVGCSMPKFSAYRMGQ